MRAFAWILGALIAAALIGAILAYPAYELTSHFQPWPFHRVAGRITMLVLVLELVWLCRYLGVKSKRDLGYGLAWGRFLQVSLLWGAIGIATASAGAVFLLATGLRIWTDSAYTASAAGIARLVLIALTSGIAVGLSEETVVRGAMHTAIERESGSRLAVLLTAPLYAILHFFDKASIPAAQVNWSSGFTVLRPFLENVSHLNLVFDSFLAWLAVGLVLSLTRVLTGNIAVAIGLHAGWVVVLRILQLSTARGSNEEFSMWVGRFDGLLGYWLLPWAAAIGLALWLTRTAWTPYASGESLSRRSIGSSSSR